MKKTSEVNHGLNGGAAATDNGANVNTIQIMVFLHSTYQDSHALIQKMRTSDLAS